MIGHGDPVSGRLAFEWVKNTAFKGPGDVPSVSRESPEDPRALPGPFLGGLAAVGAAL